MCVYRRGASPFVCLFLHLNQKYITFINNPQVLCQVSIVEIILWNNYTSPAAYNNNTSCSQSRDGWLESSDDFGKACLMVWKLAGCWLTQASLSQDNWNFQPPSASSGIFSWGWWKQKEKAETLFQSSAISAKITLAKMSCLSVSLLLFLAGH